MKKTGLFLAGILAAGLFAWLAFGFFGVQALFQNNEVNDEIPQFVAAASTQPADVSPDDADEQILGRGSFAQGDSTYSIEGDAFLSQIDRELNLTFTDFNVSNGPDLFVYAVRTDSTNNQMVKQAVADGNFVNLGALKGNIGDQNYILEAGLDHEEYQVVSIWCQRFSRNFGSALLARTAE